jgi:rRNA maturation RNase YbeY
VISIKVDSDPALEGPLESAVISIINSVFEIEGILNSELSLIFGSDDLLSNLKKEFFQKDQFTDVIAFRLNNYREKEVEGEIYISLPRAKENAGKFNEPFKKELGRLIIHGGLHLLGYEDESEDNKKIMTEKENHYLEKVNWDALYG